MSQDSQSDIVPIPSSEDRGVLSDPVIAPPLALPENEHGLHLASIRASLNAVEEMKADIAKKHIFVEGAHKSIESLAARSNEVIRTINNDLESARTVAKELGSIAEAIPATQSQADQSRADCQAASENIRAVMATVTDHASRVDAFRAQVEQIAQVAATRSNHIEDGQKYVDAKRAEVDALCNSAQQSANAAEVHNQACRSVAEHLNSLNVSAHGVKQTVDTNADAIRTARNAAESNTAATKRLADIAESVETRVAQYEARLAEMQAGNESQKKIIDELLLGATNAGLASAFDTRSRRFRRPESFWQGLFLGSLVGLIGLAVYEAITFGNTGLVPTWEALARMFANRLPFLIPLVWLAIHSSRQALLAKRMEEEYAFKATISTSFEGYRRQMAEVSKDLVSGSPLARLCTETIGSILTPPGHVYDKHRIDPTPATAAAEIIEPVSEAIAKATAARLKGTTLIK